MTSFAYFNTSVSCLQHVHNEGGTVFGKSILQVPDTGTRVLDNTRPFLCSSIVSFWITLACSKERKDHIFGQYWYTKNVPVLTNTGTFQYLGPEVYFFPVFNDGYDGHAKKTSKKDTFF